MSAPTLPPPTAAPTATPTPVPAPQTARPISAGEPRLDPELMPRLEQAWLFGFVVVPFLALLAAVPLAWGRWLSWHDLVIGVVFYNIAGLGITVGYHRLFTHGSFRANRAVTLALAVAGSLAIEGSVVRWVADHRRHHAFSDQDGDPHSPWRYGQNVPALAKGFFFAHVGWLFERRRTNPKRYAPDLLADRDVVAISRTFPALVAISMLSPALIGGLWSMSWQGAATAFFWASLVRVALLHHVTWSINSICHTVGEQPFKSRDHAGNVWWLALASFGESWHNLHHADPTCARHGALPGQIDTSARVIWLLERAGWVSNVRWPKPDRLAARLAAPSPAGRVTPSEAAERA